MNNKPRVEVDGIKTPKSPALAWENKPYRIVVVYNISGSDPAVILEKMIGKDSLGEEAWLKVDLPKEVPVALLKDLALLASGDDTILRN